MEKFDLEKMEKELVAKFPNAQKSIREGIKVFKTPQYYARGKGSRKRFQGEWVSLDDLPHDKIAARIIDEIDEEIDHQVWIIIDDWDQYQDKFSELINEPVLEWYKKEKPDECHEDDNGNLVYDETAFDDFKEECLLNEEKYEELLAWGYNAMHDNETDQLRRDATENAANQYSVPLVIISWLEENGFLQNSLCGTVIPDDDDEYDDVDDDWVEESLPNLTDNLNKAVNDGKHTLEGYNKEVVGFEDDDGKIEKKSASILLDEANELSKSGKIDEAIEKLHFAVDLYPQDENCLFDLGLLYDKKKDYDKAVLWLERVIKLKPSDNDFKIVLSRACYNRAYELSNEGKLNEAIAILHRAVELRPNYIDYINQLGCFYHEKGEYDTAISYLDSAIEKDPDYCLIYNSRGDCHFSNGDFTKAVADFQKAVELDPRDQHYKDNLAKAEAALKKQPKTAQ
jgi:tetratricopeptide (TPR) repeat protein